VFQLYGDKDGDILQWSQGSVIKVLKEEKTFVTVQIKWDKECLKEGDREISQDKLMRSKWNSNEHEQETLLGFYGRFRRFARIRE
jgi:hypothetical protein